MTCGKPRIFIIARHASRDCSAPGNAATKSHKGTMWDFGYDGDGVCVATVTTSYDESGTPNGSTWTAYYFGGAYEVRSDNTTIKYYSFAGQMVAMNDGAGLQYFLTDHLGSVACATKWYGCDQRQRHLNIATKILATCAPKGYSAASGQISASSRKPITAIPANATWTPAWVG